MATIPSVTLEERVEFGTAKWAQTLEAYLNDTDLPTEVRFKHNVRLSELPQHLIENGNSTFGFKFEIANGCASVTGMRHSRV